MQITRPDYYKAFTCIADVCPDTCCAGWQIVIDEKSLRKYRRVKGPFGGRLHNDIDWKEQVFRQYNRRCAFLNEDNLCDIYSEAGKRMLCDTCRKYPRHIEEFMAFPDLFPFEKLVPVQTELEITGCSKQFPYTKAHGNLAVL